MGAGALLVGAGAVEDEDGDCAGDEQPLELEVELAGARRAQHGQQGARHSVVESTTKI